MAFLSSFFLSLTVAILAHAAPAIPTDNSSAIVTKKIFSEAVAQVSDQVITSREVIASYMMDQALAEPPKKKAAINHSHWLIQVNSDDFRKHLAQIVLESLSQLEAENFSIGQINSADAQSYEKHVEEMVSGWDPWDKLAIKKPEMNLFLSRKLRAKNFLKFKMDTSGVQISDEEAKAYFEKNRVKFGSLPFAQFKEGIKEVLSQEQIQEKLKDWFDILKRKYRVKFLGQNSSAP